MTKLLKVGSLLATHTKQKLLTASATQSRVLTTTTLSNQQQPKQAATEQKAENFLNGSSAAYIEEVYQSWLADPKSVHKSWDIYFRTNSVQAPPTLGQSTSASNYLPAVSASSSPDLNQILRLLQQLTGQSTGKPTYAAPSLLPSTPEEKQVEDHLKLYSLIRSYQIRGHKKASLDPLGISRSLDVTNEKVHDLTPEFYNFTELDMQRMFKLPKTTFIGGEEQSLTLQEILNRLNYVYSRSIGLFNFLLYFKICLNSSILSAHFLRN
jgi:2-oxoglutarate dehydrogenase E1 component